MKELDIFPTWWENVVAKWWPHKGRSRTQVRISPGMVPGAKQHPYPSTSTAAELPASFLDRFGQATPVETEIYTYTYTYIYIYIKLTLTCSTLNKGEAEKNFETVLPEEQDSSSKAQLP